MASSFAKTLALAVAMLLAASCAGRVPSFRVPSSETRPTVTLRLAGSSNNLASADSYEEPGRDDEEEAGIRELKGGLPTWARTLLSLAIVGGCAFGLVLVAGDSE